MSCGLILATHTCCHSRDNLTVISGRMTSLALTLKKVGPYHQQAKTQSLWSYHLIQKKAYLDQVPVYAEWGEAPDSWSHVWPVLNIRNFILIPNSIWPPIQKESHCNIFFWWWTDSYVSTGHSWVSMMHKKIIIINGCNILQRTQQTQYASKTNNGAAPYWF